MLTNDEAKMIAATIFKQLGGGRFRAMTGARELFAHNEGSGGCSFKLPRIPGVKINYVKIILNANDLYDVTFGRIFKDEYKVISEFKDVYNDQLIGLFEDETGLATSL